MSDALNLDPRGPSYADTPARSLVGERMLIIGTHPSFEEDSLRVHAQLKRKGKRNRFVCFTAGMVVRQQLASQRFFPIWARLSLVQGKKHEYYQLNLAGTFEVCKRKHWRIAFDVALQDWKLETVSEP